jgi:hypothetical protein
MVFFACVMLIGVALVGITTLMQSDVRNAFHAVDPLPADLPIIASAKAAGANPIVQRSAVAEIEPEPVQVESDAFPHARPAPMLLERLSAEEFSELKKESVERIVADDATPWHDGGKQTYKTVCVRLCDGAYFPISFATTRSHFAKDEAQCISRCGSPARLFVFPNPGGNSDTMRDRSGRSYLALPTAFQFRQGPVAGCSCRPEPWEAASRDRHRMLALEADLAVGKEVDTVELTALRESLAHAKSEALSGTTPVEPIVIPETTATIRNENGIEAATAKLPATEVAALESEAPPPNQFSAIRRTDASGAAAEIAPLPVTTSIEQVDAGINLPARASAKAKRASAANRKSAKRRVTSPVIADEVMIWGFGPGAYNNTHPGTTAYEAFARNFY